MKEFEKVSNIKSLPASTLAIYSFDYTSPAVAAKSKIGQEIVGNIKLLESNGILVNVLSKNNTTPFDAALAKMNISLKNNYTPLKKMVRDLTPRKIFFGERSSVINEDYCEDICFSSFQIIEEVILVLEESLKLKEAMFDIDAQIVHFEDGSCQIEEAIVAAALQGYDVAIKDDLFFVKTRFSKVS